MLVNSILVAIVTHYMQFRNQHIYHIGSSLRNPLKYGDIRNFFFFYFSKNPWINDSGKFMKVKEFKDIKSMPKFRRYIATHYIPFLTVSPHVCVCIYIIDNLCNIYIFLLLNFYL